MPGECLSLQDVSPAEIAKLMGYFGFWILMFVYLGVWKNKQHF